MPGLPNCGLHIYVYVCSVVAAPVFSWEVSSCSRPQLIQRLITGQSAKNKWLSDGPKSRHLYHPFQGSGVTTEEWVERMEEAMEEIDACYATGFQHHVASHTESLSSCGYLHRVGYQHSDMEWGGSRVAAPPWGIWYRQLRAAGGSKSLLSVV